MSIETLRRLIDKYGAHCTLAEAIIREGRARIRQRLGLPLDASEAEVDAATEQMVKDIIEGRPYARKGNPS